MNESIEPKLAPPGAGLPTIELFIARLLSRWRRWNGSRESFNANFMRERELIRKLYSNCNSQVAARRVLIKRLRGLEDSSRYWSVWMTLDHLRMVNGSIAKIIDKLGQNIVPPGAASTAAVKPNTNANAPVAVEYELSSDAVLAAAAAVSNLKTSARFRHPWFGPLDALGWHGLAGAHMAIHRGQIERILRGIQSEPK